MSFDYDNGGRISTFKGTNYNYTGSYHVHGVKTVDAKSFIYDDNGNQTNSDGRTLTYTAFNKTKSIVKDSNKAFFEYDK